MKQSDWPTLGNMIDSGKRVVVFLDYGADGSDGGVVDFILPEFDMVSKCNVQSVYYDQYITTFGCRSGRLLMIRRTRHSLAPSTAFQVACRRLTICI
jgi:hypothetical protein